MTFYKARRIASVAIVITALSAGLGFQNTRAASEPDAASLLDNMRLAVVPLRPQIGRVTLILHNSDNETKIWHLTVARKRFVDGPHTVVGFISPKDERGTALLAAPMQDGHGYGLWFYLPSARRVRELTPLDATKPFVGTDFNFVDLAMTPDPAKDVHLIGNAELDDHSAYIVESKPGENSEWQYLRTVTWIAADTKLPLRRELYDRANRLWKVATYRNTVIDGTATVMNIQMADVQTRSYTEWRLDEVRYDQKVDDAVFSASTLGNIVDNPLWNPLGTPALATGN